MKKCRKEILWFKFKWKLTKETFLTSELKKNIYIENV